MAYWIASLVLIFFGFLGQFSMTTAQIARK